MIFGGTKELFGAIQEHSSGMTKFNPIYVELGCLTIVGVGVYLIFIGRKKEINIQNSSF